MLDYLLGFCQTKKSVSIVLLCLLACVFSCSAPPSKHFVEMLPAKPVWFYTHERFTSKNEDQSYTSHPFFDLVPFSSQKDKMVNFVVLTPEGESKRYDIDLYSGKLYSKFHLCKQNDVWDNYTGNIYTPNFTEGFIPRLLDSAGLPQKIIVFGGSDAYKRNISNAVGSHRVKVVGGVIEQMCEKYPCLVQNEWLARMVLVAVDPTYHKFREVNDLYDLKNLIDWKYTLAYLANSSGRTFESGQEFPYIRVVDEIDSEKAMRFAIEKGYLYEYGDMIKLRNTCHDLYDYVWKKIKELRTIKEKLADKKWIDSMVSKNLEKQKKDKKIDSAELVKLRREMMEKTLYDLSKDNFAKFFLGFYKNFNDKFSVCSKYVKATNVNDDIEKHWFFAYLQGFTYANDLGYVYSCSKKEWFKNYLSNRGEKALNQLEEISKCSTLALDEAFVKIPNLFNRLMNSMDGPFYRYVTYDFFDGSHEKMYSWVKVSSKKISCKKKPDSIWSRIQGMMAEDNVKMGQDEAEFIFPSDITWDTFSVDNTNKFKTISQ